MMRLVGLVGSALLAMCGVPQVLKTYRTKSAQDLSWLFIAMWAGGEVATFVYLLDDNFATRNFQYPLYVNYGFNLLVVCLLLYGKVRYGNSHKEKDGL